MISIFVALVLAVAALAFVLYPVVRSAPHASLTPLSPSPRREQIESVEDEQVQPSEEREQAARDALREIELDYQLGNIVESDYRAQRERYMQQALVALKSRYDHEQELDTLIEEQLRQLKEKENGHGNTH